MNTDKSTLRRISFFITILTGIILILGNIPIYGYVEDGRDPFQALRIILVSMQGTIAEIIVIPIMLISVFILSFVFSIYLHIKK